MTNTLKILGRVLFAVPIAFFGLNHLMNAGNMAGMVPGFIPGGIFWVYLTGVALLAAGISIIIGKKAWLASLLLGLLLLVFVLTMHIPSVISPDGGHMAMINLLKDISLIGGALLIAGIMNQQNHSLETEKAK